MDNGQVLITCDSYSVKCIRCVIAHRIALHVLTIMIIRKDGRKCSAKQTSKARYRECPDCRKRYKVTSRRQEVIVGRVAHVDLDALPTTVLLSNRECAFSSEDVEVLVDSASRWLLRRERYLLCSQLLLVNTHALQTSAISQNEQKTKHRTCSLRLPQTPLECQGLLHHRAGIVAGRHDADIHAQNVQHGMAEQPRLQTATGSSAAAASSVLTHLLDP